MALEEVEVLDMVDVVVGFAAELDVVDGGGCAGVLSSSLPNLFTNSSSVSTEISVGFSIGALGWYGT